MSGQGSLAAGADWYTRKVRLHLEVWHLVMYYKALFIDVTFPVAGDVMGTVWLETESDLHMERRAVGAGDAGVPQHCPATCCSADASQEQAWGRLAQWGGKNLDLRFIGTEDISTQCLQNFAKSYKNKNLETITTTC